MRTVAYHADLGASTLRVNSGSCELKCAVALGVLLSRLLSIVCRGKVVR
jgi:hypothetical protein